jgi:CRISPR-associated protein Cas1
MRANVQKIVLDDYGSYLGMEKGCFVVRDKHGESWKYPLFESEIGEVVLRSGNAVSTSALASMGFWGINVLILTQEGKPIAVLKSLDDDDHVKTRICQYEALKNGKGIEIAKAVVYAKIESQNLVLRKYGLRQHDLMMVKDKINSLESDSLSMLRKRLLPIEGKLQNIILRKSFSCCLET